MRFELLSVPRDYSVRNALANLSTRMEIALELCVALLQQLHRSFESLKPFRIRCAALRASWEGGEKGKRERC